MYTTPPRHTDRTIHYCCALTWPFDVSKYVWRCYVCLYFKQRRKQVQFMYWCPKPPKQGPWNILQTFHKDRQCHFWGQFHSMSTVSVSAPSHPANASVYVHTKCYLQRKLKHVTYLWTAIQCAEFATPPPVISWEIWVTFHLSLRCNLRFLRLVLKLSSNWVRSPPPNTLTPCFVGVHQTPKTDDFCAFCQNEMPGL